MNTNTQESLDFLGAKRNLWQKVFILLLQKKKIGEKSFRDKEFYLGLLLNSSPQMKKEFTKKVFLY